jgi:glycosyltransferase involved in cell wall biosynthesis
MVYSVIIPSFNQDRFIRETLENVVQLKSKAAKKNIEVEILLFDNESNEKVQNIINEYRTSIDVIKIEKDKGQFDAINKGILKCRGDYWTWLNTDDLINEEGFFRIVHILEHSKSLIDYIYGDIEVIDESSRRIKVVKAENLKLDIMINDSPGINQPGSFFRKKFTEQIGLLKNYRCCFDYEYVIRLLKNKGKIYPCNFIVSSFRYYNDSKSGSLVKTFIREQLQISKEYGRKTFSKLSMISFARLIKRFITKG